MGNIYRLAVRPTVLTGSAPCSQSIYYAKNILAATAGANTVTVTFNAAGIYPDIRILEYSGVDPVNAVDGIVGTIGNSATSSNGGVQSFSFHCAVRLRFLDLTDRPFHVPFLFVRSVDEHRFFGMPQGPRWIGFA